MNLFTIADASYRDELRDKFLGDAIPATSFAAGANFTGGGLKSYNMQTETPIGWPRKDSDQKAIWEHSDVKDVSFYFTYKLFDKINNGD
jgi:hypothetical protein